MESALKSFEQISRWRWHLTIDISCYHRFVSCLFTGVLITHCYDGALTLLVCHKEEYLACKNLNNEVLAWLCYRIEVQLMCMWCSWCHCHPIIVYWDFYRRFNRSSTAVSSVHLSTCMLVCFQSVLNRLTFRVPLVMKSPDFWRLKNQAQKVLKLDIRPENVLKKRWYSIIKVLKNQSC